MAEIEYIDGITNRIEREDIYGKFFIELLYGRHPFSWITALLLLPLCRFSFFSKLYGLFQKSRFSRFKILPFIKKYQIDASEFLLPVSSFRSFNDFFIRKLRPSVRPMVEDPNVVVLPADARYLVYSTAEHREHFLIKEKKFNLTKLIEDEALAKQYEKGTMVIARLCPIDYHRFHFPCDCIPSSPKLITGALYSVNLLALKRKIEFLTENKRYITQLKTKLFGTILFIEIGATYVGSITHTYLPDQFAKKGQEKGYFSFGGSCVILLFEPNRILLEQRLLSATAQGLEMRGQLGQSLGHSVLT